MTGISASRPPAQQAATPVRQPTGQPSQQPAQSRAEPAPNDLRAMKDAMANARRQMGEATGGAAEQAGAGKAGGGKAEGHGKSAGAYAKGGRELSGQGQQPGVLPDARDVASFAGSLASSAEAKEGLEGLPGFAGLTPGGAPVPMTIPAMPAPHVDPSAFAQMMADLWTRENGRGSKEVSVRFGNSAWPATGARLVRNAAGGVDIALQVGDGGRAYGGDKLSGLESALTQAGVDFGSLEVENDVV